jgi:hypothetical protein
MKKLAIFAILFWGVLAAVAEAREAWRVERYEDAACPHDGYKVAWQGRPARNSWLPRITPGWPFGKRWTIKWEGTF